MKLTDQDVLNGMRRCYAATSEMARALRERADDLTNQRAYDVYTVMIDTGSTQADIAAVLGVSESHVQAMVRKARAMDLRELWFHSAEQQGRWVKELRTRAGMSPRDLAKAAGVPQTWLRELERGQAELSGGVMMVFDALGVRPENYVGEYRDRPPR